MVAHLLRGNELWCTKILSPMPEDFLLYVPRRLTRVEVPSFDNVEP